MVIKNIKIFGERNSGTNYLTQLLIKNIKNIKNINILSSSYKEGTGWKHGFPKIELFNDINNTLFIFIIRDLKSWLKSMYKQPYHYKPQNSFKKFLNDKLIINDKKNDHDVNIYRKEKQNIIDLRYLKINSYLNFFKKVNNALIINLLDLQNNSEKFIHFLHKNYIINMNEKIINITKHTKNNKLNIPNRDWNVNIPNNIKKENKVIEHFVDNLKNNYHFKSDFKSDIKSDIK